jgi:hypothetical protein
MKTLTSAAIVALTAAVIGAGGIAAASAQQAPMQPQAPGQFQPGPGGPGQFGQFNRRGGGEFRDFRAARGGGGMRAGGGLLDLVCSERGAERLEIAFVRMSHRVELTAEQQGLFDALKTAALTAQTEFADTCAAARPTAVAEGQQPAPVDPVARMQGRIDIEKAHTAALESVLPAFEAFYNSLTDEQKAQLAPQRRGNDKGPGRPHMGELDAPALPGEPAEELESAPAGLIG